MKLNRAMWTAGAAFAVLSLGMVPLGLQNSRSECGVGPFVAQAQNLGERVVTGWVNDADSKPVSGATVFLKNQKSKAIRSFTTTDKGEFQFAQVNMAEDFDLWAEKDSKKTAVKTVSSWDARKQFEVELKLK